MNKEELKTVIGSLMSDLRGNWAYYYTERMRLLIELLNELGVKKTKGIQIRMNAVSISPEIISQIEKLCQEYSGGTPLYLKLRDEQENISLEMLSRKFRVRAVNDMVRKMKRIPEIEVEVVNY